MRTTRFYQGLFLVLTLSLMSIDCDPDSVLIEGDTDGPVITVISPDNNDVFYVENGVETPNTLVIRANATDESTIIFASASFIDSSGDQIDYFERTSGSLNSTSINAIDLSFTTVVPGEYRVVIEFVDAVGNSTTIEREVTCLPSETDVPS